MAHKTLINGTAYSVSGGKTLVNGTGYSIKNGKTLVGGTAYAIGFAAPMAKLTIDCNAQTSQVSSYITVNGITIYNTNSDTTLEVPVGSVVTCTISHMDSGLSSYSYIKVNGTKVLSGKTGSYNYVVTGNAKIEIKDQKNIVNERGGYIIITAT